MTEKKYASNYGGSPKMPNSAGSTLKNFGKSPNIEFEYEQLNINDQVEPWEQIVLYQDLVGVNYACSFARVNGNKFFPIWAVWGGGITKVQALERASIQHSTCKTITIIDLTGVAMTLVAQQPYLGETEYASSYIWWRPYESTTTFAVNTNYLYDAIAHVLDHYNLSIPVTNYPTAVQLRQIIRRVFQYQRSTRDQSTSNPPIAVKPLPEPIPDQEIIFDWDTPEEEPLQMVQEQLGQLEKIAISDAENLADFGVSAGYRSTIVNNIFINLPYMATVDNIVTSKVWNQIPELEGKIAIIYAHVRYSNQTNVHVNVLYLPGMTQYKKIEWRTPDLANIEKNMYRIWTIYNETHRIKNLFVVLEQSWKIYQKLIPSLKQSWRGLDTPLMFSEPNQADYSLGILADALRYL